MGIAHTASFTLGGGSSRRSIVRQRAACLPAATLTSRYSHIHSRRRRSASAASVYALAWFSPEGISPSRRCSRPRPSPSRDHSPSTGASADSEAGMVALAARAGERVTGTVGDTVPGRWSGERFPDVISFRDVTVVGTESRRSL